MERVPGAGMGSCGPWNGRCEANSKEVNGYNNNTLV